MIHKAIDVLRQLVRCTPVDFNVYNIGPSEALQDVLDEARQVLKLWDDEELLAELHRLRRAYPIGTPCRYWTMAREGEGKRSRIRSTWYLNPQREIMVQVEGHPAGIIVTHVECVDPR